MKNLFLYTLLFFFSQSTLARDISAVLNKMDEIDVLLVSDHTLPEHLNLSSGGANGEERSFIDPTLKSLQTKLSAQQLESYILNVEDMTINGIIAEKSVFDAAYQRYDQILRKAVENNLTIVSVHFDADVLYDESDPKKIIYQGGIQLILDKRATSPQTLELANQLIHQDKILRQLHDVGFNYRPDYDDEVRYQNNLTLNIAGHSKGGAFLLEIAPQDQAIRLFNTPEKIVAAIDKPLTSLASSLANFRSTKMTSDKG